MSVFCYTGLSKDEVSRLKEEYHIYITADGRISMAGITSANVEYVALTRATHKLIFLVEIERGEDMYTTLFEL